MSDRPDNLSEGPDTMSEHSDTMSGSPETPTEGPDAATERPETPPQEFTAHLRDHITNLQLDGLCEYRETSYSANFRRALNEIEVPANDPVKYFYALKNIPCPAPEDGGSLPSANDNRPRCPPYGEWLNTNYEEYHEQVVEQFVEEYNSQGYKHTYNDVDIEDMKKLVFAGKNIPLADDKKRLEKHIEAAAEQTRSWLAGFQRNKEEHDKVCASLGYYMPQSTAEYELSVHLEEKQKSKIRNMEEIAADRNELVRALKALHERDIDAALGRIQEKIHTILMFNATGVEWDKLERANQKESMPKLYQELIDEITSDGVVLKDRCERVLRRAFQKLAPHELSLFHAFDGYMTGTDPRADSPLIQEGSDRYLLIRMIRTVPEDEGQILNALGGWPPDLIRRGQEALLKYVDKLSEDEKRLLHAATRMVAVHEHLEKSQWFFKKEVEREKAMQGKELFEKMEAVHIIDLTSENGDKAADKPENASKGNKNKTSANDNKDSTGSNAKPNTATKLKPALSGPVTKLQKAAAHRQAKAKVKERREKEKEAKAELSKKLKDATSAPKSLLQLTHVDRMTASEQKKVLNYFDDVKKDLESMAAEDYTINEMIDRHGLTAIDDYTSELPIEWEQKIKQCMDTIGALASTNREFMHKVNSHAEEAHRRVNSFKRRLPAGQKAGLHYNNFIIRSYYEYVRKREIREHAAAALHARLEQRSDMP